MLHYFRSRVYSALSFSQQIFSHFLTIKKTLRFAGKKLLNIAKDE